MRRPTERRCVLWLNSVRRTTFHSTSTRPRSWWWITGDRAENTHPSPSTRHLWSGWAALSSSAFTSPEDLTWSAHTDAVLKKAHQRLFLLDGWVSLGTTPESSDTSTMHCGEHPDRCITACWETATRRSWASPEDQQRLQPPVPDCSLCCPQEDVSVATDPALADWGIALSLRLSGQWTVRNNTPYSTLSLYSMPWTALHTHTAHTHTAQIQKSGGSNAHPWHCVAYV